MVKKLKYLIVILLFPLWASAQLEADNWIYSIVKYVNFNKANQPAALSYPPGLAPFGRGTTTYSDKNGQLLFYSDGAGFHNRTFNLSPATTPYLVTGGHTGEFLYGCSWNFCQTVLAVPYPGNDSLFLLFHINYEPNNNFQPKLLYSVINMKSDSGRGDVDYIQRNIPLFGSDTNVLFKLTAILHCNKKDIWVVGHLANSDKYFSLLITANGISTAKLFSSGSYINSPVGPDSIGHQNLDGAVKVSPLGNRIAAAFKGLNNIELGDFNTQTGAVSNIKTLVAAPPPSDTVFIPSHTRNYGPIGVDFSPTGNRLYASSTYEVNGTEGVHLTSFIYQFDASLPTQTQIQNSRYFIDSLYHNRSGAIQLANNGKTYVNVQDHLCEIANPENLGAACNFTRFTVLTGNQSPTLGLPIFLQSYLRYPIIATGNCQFQNINFNIQNPEGISSISWDFGDPASGISNTSSSFTPTHIYTTQGIYKVKAVLQNTNGCSADTIFKVINAGPFKVYLGKDTALCQGDTLQLNVNIPYSVNQWSNGSIDSSIKITQSGTYWVKVNLGDCSATDTIVVSFNNLPQFNLGNDTVICNSANVLLSPNPVYPTAMYLWNTSATSTSITTGLAGDYWLRITDNNGCKWLDTIKVSFKNLPGYTLGRDTSICQKDTLLLSAIVSGANSYLWNNGITLPVIKVYQPNTYWCDVTKDGCTYRDSLILNINLLPVVNLGTDLTLCEDNTLLLDATNINASYLWQDASINSTYLVKQKGVYWVKVTLNGCISNDTIKISYDLKPRFSLNTTATRICLGSEIVLDPQLSGVTYLWQDGSTASTYKVIQPGLYILTATNNCGPTSVSINIDKGVCDLYIPNSFTPNNDNKNDLFRSSYGDNVIDFHMQVFNRYGQLVFETRDKNKGWDGNFMGSRQPNGAYVWLIEYKTTSNTSLQRLQGTVLLLH